MGSVDHEATTGWGNPAGTLIPAFPLFAYGVVGGEKPVTLKVYWGFKRHAVAIRWVGDGEGFGMEL